MGKAIIRIVVALVSNAVLAAGASPVSAWTSSPRTTSSRGISLEREALAAPALQQLRSFNRHVSALVNRWSERRNPAYAGAGVPSPEYHHDFEAWRPETAVHMADQDATGGVLPLGEADGAIAGAHRMSLEAMDYLDTFTRIGAMSMPLIRNQMNRTSPTILTTAEALRSLREDPAAVAVFGWSQNLPPWTKLLGLSLGGPVPRSKEELRQQVRDIRLIWLVRADAQLWRRIRELRDDVVDFCKAMAEIKSSHVEGLHALLGVGAEERAAGGDATSRDPEILGRLIQEAGDIATWDGRPSEASRWFEEAREFARHRVNQRAASPEQTERLRKIIEVAATGVWAMRSDSLGYMRRHRLQAIREIDRSALRFLSSGVTWPITIDIPGGDVDVTASQDTKVLIVGSLIPPSDAQELQAPWLHTVRLLVQRSFDAVPSMRLPNVAGIPIKLTSQTGESRVRPLRPIGEPSQRGSFYEAEFLDVEDGRFLLEIAPLDDPSSRSRAAEQRPNDPENRQSSRNGGCFDRNRADAFSGRRQPPGLQLLSAS